MLQALGTSTKFFVVSSLSYGRTDCLWSSLGVIANCRKFPLMCSIWHWNQSVFKGESLLVMSCFQILKNYFSFFVGLRFYSLDRSLTQSSGTAKPLLTVNVQSLSNCFKWKALEVCDWRNKYYSIFKTYVAFIQIQKKCDWDGQMINHWFLLTVPVSYQENQWWELWQSSTGRCCRDVQYEQILGAMISG